MNIIETIFIASIGTLVGFVIGMSGKGKKKSINRVHFYVARDKNGELWLYLGKPERWRNRFSNFHGTCRNFTANEYHFEDVGLNPDDFKNLKWEDEPVEVLLNLED